MSSFGGILEEYPHFLIDNFESQHLRNKSWKYLFLSHFHTDHMKGLGSDELYNYLSQQGDAKLICSRITKWFLLSDRRYNRLEPFILEYYDYIPFGLVTFSNGQDVRLMVTLIPNAHIPGSVMFLFEGPNGNVLYTGDFRMPIGETRLFQCFRTKGNLPFQEREYKTFKAIYVDATFCKAKITNFPSRTESRTELCKAIKLFLREENTIVKLTLSGNFGSEFLFVELYEKLGIQVHVTPEKKEYYKFIPRIQQAVTENLDTRVHLAMGGSRSLCGSKCFQGKQVREIALTTMWHVRQNNALTTKLDGSKTRILYSMHCSEEELVDFLRTLKPQKIYPTAFNDKEYTFEEVKEYLTSKVAEISNNSSSPDLVEDSLPPLTLSRDIVGPTLLASTRLHFNPDLESPPITQDPLISRQESLTPIEGYTVNDFGYATSQDVTFSDAKEVDNDVEFIDEVKSTGPSVKIEAGTAYCEHRVNYDSVTEMQFWAINLSESACPVRARHDLCSIQAQQFRQEESNYIRLDGDKSYESSVSSIHVDCKASNYSIKDSPIAKGNESNVQHSEREHLVTTTAVAHQISKQSDVHDQNMNSERLESQVKVSSMQVPCAANTSQAASNHTTEASKLEIIESYELELSNITASNEDHTTEPSGAYISSVYAPYDVYESPVKRNPGDMSRKPRIMQSCERGDLNPALSSDQQIVDRANVPDQLLTAPKISSDPKLNLEQFSLEASTKSRKRAEIETITSFPSRSYLTLLNGDVLQRPKSSAVVESEYKNTFPWKKERNRDFILSSSNTNLKGIEKASLGIERKTFLTFVEYSPAEVNSIEHYVSKASGEQEIPSTPMNKGLEEAETGSTLRGIRNCLNDGVLKRPECLAAICSDQASFNPKEDKEHLSPPYKKKRISDSGAAMSNPNFEEVAKPILVKTNISCCTSDGDSSIGIKLTDHKTLITCRESELPYVSDAKEIAKKKKGTQVNTPGLKPVSMPQTSETSIGIKPGQQISSSQLASISNNSDVGLSENVMGLKNYNLSSMALRCDSEPPCPPNFLGTSSNNYDAIDDDNQKTITRSVRDLLLSPFKLSQSDDESDDSEGFCLSPRRDSGLKNLIFDEFRLSDCSDSSDETNVTNLKINPDERKSKSQSQLMVLNYQNYSLSDKADSGAFKGMTGTHHKEDSNKRDTSYPNDIGGRTAVFSTPNLSFDYDGKNEACKSPNGAGNNSLINRRFLDGTRVSNKLHRSQVVNDHCCQDDNLEDMNKNLSIWESSELSDDPISNNDVAPGYLTGGDSSFTKLRHRQNMPRTQDNANVQTISENGTVSNILLANIQIIGDSRLKNSRIKQNKFQSLDEVEEIAIVLKCPSLDHTLLHSDVIPRLEEDIPLIIEEAPVISRTNSASISRSPRINEQTGPRKTRRETIPFKETKSLPTSDQRESQDFIVIDLIDKEEVVIIDKKTSCQEIIQID